MENLQVFIHLMQMNALSDLISEINRLLILSILNICLTQHGLLRQTIYKEHYLKVQMMDLIGPKFLKST